MFDEVIATFLALSTGPVEVNDENVVTLERFTILLYGRTSSMVNIDEAHQELFTKKGRPMDAIPPTKTALVQHIKRAVYQGGYCWGKMSCVCHLLRTGDGLTHSNGSRSCQKLAMLPGS